MTIDAERGRFPRLRGDVVYLEVDSGAYLRSSNDTILLRGPGTYRLVAAVVPALTGEHSVDEIVDGLADAQRRSVLDLVAALAAKQMLRISDRRRDPGAAFDAQRAYVEHFADADEDVDAAFDRFRSAAVLVVGSPAAASVVAGLLLNGIKQVAVQTDSEEEFSEALAAKLIAFGTSEVGSVEFVASDRPLGHLDAVVVDATLDRLGELRRVTQTLRQAGAESAILVPIVRTDEKAVIGPVVRSGRAGCWMCAQMRMFTNTAGTDPAVVRALAFGAPEDASVHAPVADMLGNEAAFTVFRALTRSDGGELERMVLLQELETLESRLASLIAHPDCPLCAGLPAASLEPDGEGRAEQVTPLVDKDTGVLTAWTDDALDQVPVKSGRLEFFIEAPKPRIESAVAFDLDDILAARARAVDAAFARIASIRPALPRANGVPSIAANAFDDVRSDVPIVSGHTVLARRLSDGAARAIPVEAVLRVGASSAFLRTRLGVGVGEDSVSADNSGLIGALALRGLRAATTGEAPAADFKPFDSDDVKFLMNSLRHLGRTGAVRILPGAAPAMVVVAHVVEEPDGPWTVAAGADETAATVRALTDLVGIIVGGHTDPGPWPEVHPSRFVPAAPPSSCGHEVTFDDVRQHAYSVDIAPTDLLAVPRTAIRRVVLTRESQ